MSCETPYQDFERTYFNEDDSKPDSEEYHL